ncbi:hypothetical protein A2Z33_02100 [Candidatus Gottesmanbacteria bacterium RBG_16_52_11]|uniref:Uncharacterized protein n=1 Tax=Candidatus Gottesmanbacteria bacterium RBG_16_52_11 TaxID=1798374 RepID=A0A1F5YQT3_9BACT|nr:MAG: hypothetical protein A2Z33_02100 [Candidatus Gottesmanbacteria bacterium RBG_16_52_11]
MTDTLPPHKYHGKDQACPGKSVTGAYEDVGLMYGVCPECSGSFVYLTGRDRGITEDEFDSAGNSFDARQVLEV